jgi:hypothetical protein
LFLYQSDPLQFNFSSLSPYPVLFKSFQGAMFCLVSIQMWCMSLFFHLFPSIPHPWLSSSRSTFEYMLNVYLYVYMILLVIVLGLYTTYERKKCRLLLSEPSCLHLKRCSPVSFTHMQMTIFLSSLWPNNISHFLNLFISVEHLVCFHSLPIMNNA